MSGNRLSAATLILAALLALTVWQFNARKTEDTRPPEVSLKLPKLSKDSIDELVITAPGKPGVKLKKQDKKWSLVEPLAAVADQNAVDTALSKLAELEVVNVAATQQANHAQLEVDDAHALHVIAKQGDKPLVDLLLGAYRSGNTMLRLKDGTTVASVKGSIKYGFEKEIKEWRDRNIADVNADQIKDVAFRSAAGSFHFVQDGSNWKQAQGEKPIANFDSDQVKSIVGTAARITALDFAPAETAPDAAGVGATPAGLVTLSLGGDAGPQQIVLRVGQKLDTNYYFMRDGNAPIYLVSSFVAERLMPSADKFAKTPAPAAAAGPAQAGPAAKAAKPTVAVAKKPAKPASK